MADLVDKAESDMSQLINRVGTSAASKTGQAAMHFSVTIAKTVTNAPYAAAAAVWGAAADAINHSRDTGRVALKTFTNLNDGRREVIVLDDRAVSKEFERELHRHGVTWAVEAHKDGSRTFHVQGKDAELVHHSLTVAAARVDKSLASLARADDTEISRANNGVEPAHGTDELRGDEPVRTPSEAATQPDGPSGIERDEATTDRGGHSELREPAATRREQAPTVSARDQTRRRNAERIDKKVSEKKSEIATQKSPTKRRSVSRESTEAARASRRK